MNFSLDVITVVTSPPTCFDLTRRSLARLHAADKSVRWVIVVGQTDEVIEQELRIAADGLGRQLVVHSQLGNGIYGAMNEAMDRVQSDFFMFLNSGDTVNADIMDQLANVDANHVHCYRSNWHDYSETFRRNKLTRKRISYIFGRMPNHQAMVFPNRFRAFKYDESLAIASDQNMKLSLFNLHLLQFHDRIIVSSLTGGVSARKLQLREVRIRYLESRNIFLRHYARLWAELLGATYGIRYLTRIDLSFELERLRSHRK